MPSLLKKPQPLKLTPEEEDRVRRSRLRNIRTTRVNQEWLFISEFGYYYGWHGVLAILNNEISMEEANTLLLGAKKVWYQKVVDIAHSTHVAFVAANTKNGGSVMKKGLDKFMKEAQPDATY